MSERVADRRRRLMDAALEVFYQRGYPAATVVDICREAQLSTRQFYEEFGDKEAILVSLYDEANAAAEKAVLAAMAGSSGGFANRLRDAITAYAAAMTADRRVTHLTVTSVVGVSEQFEAHRAKQRREWIDRLNAVAQTFIAAGEIPDRDYSYAWIALLGAVNALGTSTLDVMDGQPQSLDVLVDAVDRMLWGGILAP